MNNTVSISFGFGYVSRSLGNPSGDLAPTYDVTLVWPPDMTGKKLLGVENDGRVQENAKVRPAATYRPAFVFWIFGSRTVWVVGERIIFGGCNPGPSGNGLDQIREPDEKRPKNAFALSTAESGGPISPGPVGGL